MARRRLALDAIEASLRDVQREFPRINDLLQVRRDELSDVVLENLMAGYRAVDDALADGRSVFRKKQTHRILHLNHLVLCGTSDRCWKEHAQHIEATRRRFYDEAGHGIHEILLWHHRHHDESVWKRAAGVYVHILSQPQLFLEGNHRTGALIMSYLLAYAGKPPFVLTVENAKAYFDPSTLVKRTHKARTTAKLVKLPGLRKRFAAFLESEVQARFLLG